MTGPAALSVHGAVESLRADSPESYLAHDEAIPADRIAADFADRFAGVPANSRSRAERAVRYTATGSDTPTRRPVGARGSPGRAA